MTVSGNELPQEVVRIANDFLEKIAGPPAKEIGGLLADKVRYLRFKNRIKILQKAQEFLREKGISPSRVSLKILLPILNEGWLEEEESMRDKRAALLANAANPGSRGLVPPSFPEILKELSPQEALILDYIIQKATEEAYLQGKHMLEHDVTTRETCKWPVSASELKEELELSDSDFEIAIDNLRRLGLCSVPPKPVPTTYDAIQPTDEVHPVGEVRLTPLGIAFIDACRAP